MVAIDLVQQHFANNALIISLHLDELVCKESTAAAANGQLPRLCGTKKGRGHTSQRAPIFSRGLGGLRAPGSAQGRRCARAAKKTEALALVKYGALRKLRVNTQMRVPEKAPAMVAVRPIGSPPPTARTTKVGPALLAHRSASPRAVAAPPTSEVGGFQCGRSVDRRPMWPAALPLASGVPIGMQKPRTLGAMLIDPYRVAVPGCSG